MMIEIQDLEGVQEDQHKKNIQGWETLPGQFCFKWIATLKLRKLGLPDN